MPLQGMFLIRPLAALQNGNYGINFDIKVAAHHRPSVLELS